MINHIKPALLMLLFFTVLTGIAYPLAVTLLRKRYSPIRQTAVCSAVTNSRWFRINRPSV